MNQEEQSKKISQIIARCWTDASFKQRLLADPQATLKAEGVEIPEGLTVRVVENTDQVFNLVLPRDPKAELSDRELEGVTGGMLNHGHLFVSGIEKVT